MNAARTGTRERAGGFTLIELLIAMTVSLLILSLIAAFQSGSLQLSRSIDSGSRRLGNINDVSGYVSSQLRMAALTASSVNLNGTCDVDSTTAPCLAVVVPPSGGQNWTAYAYRYVSRADVPANDKVASTWLDSNAVALYEDRYVLPGTSTCAEASFTCFSGVTPVTSLLTDQLSLSQSSGGDFRPFAVSGSGPDTTLTLRWRAVSHAGGKESYTPPLPQTPYELVVNPRNIF
ncbi:prepilin-type N-terminal cleavage/methylation domain-containing protein [Deinococcus wulumuqiensis]|uniref:prepilin-type N-terminal cleavage/methylation domain-containing protein n=1 Tax=Deinococcus wulumuqiensis TaxID=980427 RepID=UPI00242E7CA7|nr:prepilin-type N-terminal cleavage/methylation domain-containing protein [Deinococcus wulumuqiensis]